jgi:diguanylate cyclase (GGDEF)-like protein/PAS domain S-box-containing protein
MSSVPEDQTKKPTGSLTQDALSHSRDLLLALSRAAQAVQKARTAEDVYHAVVDQIHLLGENVSLFIFNEDRRSLTVVHTSYIPDALDKAEKMLGHPVVGHRVVFPSDSIYARNLENGRAEYIHWTKDLVARALSQNLRPLAGEFMSLLKIRQGILAPLRADDEPLGLMFVSGASLTEDDVPAMESFAAQIAISLRNVRFMQQLQDELSIRRQMEENSILQSAALEAAANAIAIIGRNGVIQWVNPAWVELTGYSKEESIGQNPRIIRSGRHSQTFYKNMWETILAGRVWRGEVVNRRKDGGLYVEEETITPVLNGEGRVTHFIAIKLDITKRKEAETTLERLARTDALTGVHNRHHLFEFAAHEFDVARRYGHALSIIMFDLDRFKEVNDNFGHAVGDQVLKQVTQVACSQLREVDLLGRYGGEEFLVILPNTGAQQARLLAERIRSGVEALRVETDKGSVSVTLSIGITEMSHAPQDGSVDDLIRHADEALYLAKKSGRNRVVIYEANAMQDADDNSGMI